MMNVFGRASLARLRPYYHRSAFLKSGINLTQSRKMRIITIPMWEDNYGYAVFDEKSGEFALIDPADWKAVEPVYESLVRDGGVFTVLINTHHHVDHTAGNEKAIAKQPKVAVIAGRDCPGVTVTPVGVSNFGLGLNIVVTPYFTPCHTEDSICFMFEDEDEDQKAIFTGDTLFNGGCGKFFEGKAADMNKSLNEVLAKVPDDALVYPGHEYTKSNAEWALTIPGLENDPALKKLLEVTKANKSTTGLFTMAEERKHNVFMRATEKLVQKGVRERRPVDTVDALRKMKNDPVAYAAKPKPWGIFDFFYFYYT